jgi:type I restriction enzyme, S subunit
MTRPSVRKISEVAKKVCVGYVGTCQKDYCDAVDGVPMFRTTNLAEGKLTYEDLKFVTRAFHEKNKKSQLKYGDILVARHGDNGKACMYLDDAEANCLNVVIIRPDEERVDPKFLLYLFNSPLTRQTIGSYSTGSVQDVVNTKDIANLELEFPSLSLQRQIADVLNSFDDKIDLLHRQNQTLEQMAETLYRQWFEEGVMDDWEKVPASSCIRLVGGGTPSTSESAYWGGQIKWLSAKDITAAHKQFAFTSEKTITEAGLRNSSTRMLPKYAMVISARGTVGKYCMLSGEMCFSQSNYGVLPQDGESFLYTYLFVANIVEELQASAYGTVFDTITTRTFAEVQVTKPPKNLVHEFNTLVEPLFEKMLVNTQQIDSLKKTRDTLLPKLMNGEVSTQVKYDKMALHSEEAC